jgi:hypothetical protein
VRSPLYIVATILAASALWACPKQSLDAKQTCEQFLEDIHARRGERAFDKLSEGSKTELRRRHLALVEAGGGDEDASPAYLIFKTLDIERISTPESIAEASRPDDEQVLLRVAVKSGDSADIRMVKEGEAWKVDLFASLQPVSPRHEPEDPETE